MKGQDEGGTGCALILMPFVVAVIVVITLTMGVPHTESKFERRDAIVQECVASERYTREECIVLAGSQ